MYGPGPQYLHGPRFRMVLRGQRSGVPRPCWLPRQPRTRGSHQTPGAGNILQYTYTSHIDARRGPRALSSWLQCIEHTVADDEDPERPLKSRRSNWRLQMLTPTTSTAEMNDECDATPPTKRRRPNDTDDWLPRHEPYAKFRFCVTTIHQRR